MAYFGLQHHPFFFFTLVTLFGSHTFVLKYLDFYKSLSIFMVQGLACKIKLLG
jgi:hypothetical protein